MEEATVAASPYEREKRARQKTGHRQILDLVVLVPNADRVTGFDYGYVERTGVLAFDDKFALSS
jgi:hypothetical protein